MAAKKLKDSDSKNEFYFYLGLLSTKFAIMEYNILLLLGKLIADDFVLTATILERNSLDQNVQLLKKINKFRGYEEKSFAKIIENILTVKRNRNLFIHGIWSEPEQLKKDLIITCSEPKIFYEENDRGRSWRDRTNHRFLLGDIKKQVTQIDEIIASQKQLLEKLEENPV